LRHSILINRFFAKEISDKQLILLEKWLKKNPDNKLEFDSENEMCQLTGIVSKLDQFDVDISWNQISAKLKLERKY
jgi:hypothetical protein